MVKLMPDSLPPPVPPMSTERAIELLKDIENRRVWSHEPDLKEALAKAKAALITQELHLGGD